MKKRILLGFSLLAAAGIFVLSCKKAEPNVAPEPDMETQQAIDIAWATYVVTDIEQASAFIGENLLYDHFYIDVPWSKAKDCPSCGTVTPTRDTSAKLLGMGFNKTYCVDGKYREGTIFVNYNYNNEVNKYLAQYRNINSDPHARYYHDYGWCGLVTLSEYKIDGWRIKTLNGEPAPLYCTVSTATYDPQVERLTWMFNGKFTLEHPSDPSRNITMECKFTKTMINSIDKNVWKADKTHKNDPAVTWSLALVSYSGSAFGKIGEAAGISEGVPYAIEFGGPPANPNEFPKPLMRDFTCSSDPVYDVSQGTGTAVIVPLKSRHHPFVRGIMTFTPGVGTAKPKYPRIIYFGDEIRYNDEGAPLNDWNQYTMSANITPSTSTGGGEKAPCDNTGEVLIQGITYKVSFMK
jgi:hypothetical protein